MIHRRTNPVGLDYCIDVMQYNLYNSIRSIWSLTEEQVLSFPRVNRVRNQEIDDKEKLTYYSSGYKDEDMLLDDRYAVKFFFYPVNRADFFDRLHHQDVEIIFYINLTTVKPNITHRADEEVRCDIRNILPRLEAYRGTYDIVDLPGYEDRMDMQPFHSFKILTTITYD